MDNYRFTEEKRDVYNTLANKKDDYLQGYSQKKEEKMHYTEDPTRGKYQNQNYNPRQGKQAIGPDDDYWYQSNQNSNRKDG